MARPTLFLLAAVSLACLLAVEAGAPVFTVKLWTSPIPLAFDNRYTEEEKNTVRALLPTVSDKTCLDFAENLPGPQLEYHLETNSSANCRSAVGDTRGSQSNHLIHLVKGCIHNYTILHETMHALGFKHTDTRPDRDNYVEVAERVKTNDNYAIVPITEKTTDYGIPYEYNSLIHNPDSDVLKYKDPTYAPEFLGVRRVTFNDWKLINMHYKCSEKCTTRIVCQNGGYQHPRKCNQCVCSQFYKGTQCAEANVEQLTAGQAKTLTSAVPHDEILIKKYLNEEFENYVYNTSETRVIKAPEGTRIRVTINKLVDSLQNRYMHPSTGCTSNGFERAAEFADGDLTRVGRRICLASQSGYSFVSKSNVVGVVVYASPGLGFSANVTFTVEGTPSVPTTTTLPPTTVKPTTATTVVPTTTTTATKPVTVTTTTTTATTTKPITLPPVTTTTVKPADDVCDY